MCDSAATTVSTCLAWHTTGKGYEYSCKLSTKLLTVARRQCHVLTYRFFVGLLVRSLTSSALVHPRFLAGKRVVNGIAGWKKFTALAPRLYHLPAATRESVFGIKLSDNQSKWLSEVWNDRCWNHVELEGGPISRGKEDEEDCEVSEDEDCDDEEIHTRNKMT
jgi:hypothetical protein